MASACGSLVEQRIEVERLREHREAAARGHERGAVANALSELESKHPAVERQCAIQVGHFEMNVADADAGVDGAGLGLVRAAHDFTFASAENRPGPATSRAKNPAR